MEILQYTGVLEKLRAASSLYDEDGLTAARRQDRITMLASESHRTVDTDTLGDLLSAKYPPTIENVRHCLRFYQMVAAHLHQGN